VYICVPTTGTSIATFACPVDPIDDDWTKMSQIARDVIRKKIGSKRLYSRPVACAMAGTTMGATELITTGSGETSLAG